MLPTIARIEFKLPNYEIDNPSPKCPDDLTWGWRYQVIVRRTREWPLFWQCCFGRARCESFHPRVYSLVRTRGTSIES